MGTIKISKYPIPRPIIDSADNALPTETTLFKPDNFEWVIKFLKQHSDNKAAFESYRRELKRLIQWSWLIEQKFLLHLKRQDIENYAQYTTVFGFHPVAKR